MFGLRQKLALGFGGLLAILVIVSALSIDRMNRYSRTLETIFRENYDSVGYGQGLREAVEELDDAAGTSLFLPRPGNSELPASYEVHRAQFQSNLDREMANLTLPGERELAESIVALW